MSGLDKFLKYRELVYSKKFNLGNYENETISLTIDLSHNEDVNDAFRKLKAKVLQLQAEKKGT